MPKAIKYLSYQPLEEVALLIYGRDEETQKLRVDAWSVDVRISSRTIYRWRAAGKLPWDSADAIATRMDFHPSDIWGDEWTLMDANIIGIGVQDEKEIRAVERVLRALPIPA